VTGERLEVLHDDREVELVARAPETSQTHTLQAVVGLKMGKARLDLLSLIAGLVEPGRALERACIIAGRLVHVARDIAPRLTGWPDIGRGFQTRCRLEQAERLGAHRLGHPTRLTVGPDDWAVSQIDPSPFELEDLRQPRCKLKLESDGEEDEGVLQALDLRLMSIGIQTLEFSVSDQVFPRSGYFGDMPAWLRPNMRILRPVGVTLSKNPALIVSRGS
jgi:hypothetical protein